jgi:hypothetical protein
VKQIRKRLTYANVMSSIAVFLVLGGATALAAGQLGKNTVGSKQLKKNAVTTAKIKNGAVTGAKLRAGAVSGAALGAGSITNEKLADGAVTGNKIAGGTIGRGNLSEGALLPRAYALVEFDGKVDPKFTVGGIPNATRAGEAYCFDTPFPVMHAQATGEADGEGNDVPSVLIAGAQETFEECPPGTDVEVEVWDTGLDEETEEEFFLALW